MHGATDYETPEPAAVQARLDRKVRAHWRRSVTDDELHTA